MIENWKQIPGFESLYEASDLGRVRGMSRTVYTQRTGIARRLPVKILKPITDKEGRQQVSLCKDGVVTIIRVHRVIMLTFVGPKPDGLVTCHYDGNPSNNALSNLRYDTASGNMQDAVRHGTANTGEKCPTSKLTAEQVLEIRRLAASGAKLADLAKKYGVGIQQISRIKRRERWPHV